VPEAVDEGGGEDGRGLGVVDLVSGAEEEVELVEAGVPNQHGTSLNLRVRRGGDFFRCVANIC
jgi:hypothetical protein